jgi:hypothetical protein
MDGAGALVRVARVEPLTLAKAQSRWLVLAGIAVLLSTTVAADKVLPPVRVTAGICEKVGKKCARMRAAHAFAPARVRVDVYLAPHPDNVGLSYGLVCDGLPVQESGASPVPPMIFQEYRDVGKGECVAVATLQRRVVEAGEVRIEWLSAISGKITIGGRLDDPD